MYAFHSRLMSSEYGQVLSQQARPVFGAQFLPVMLLSNSNLTISVILPFEMK